MEKLTLFIVEYILPESVEYERTNHRNWRSEMSIQITVSQRCGGEYGQRVYFAKDCDATFSLDGNADNAQMMAGYALAGIIKAHNGDTLLIDIKLHGKRVARWVGEADTNVADEFDHFVGTRMWDFAYVCRRIDAYRES
jgi:hypothetical protein